MKFILIIIFLLLANQVTSQSNVTWGLGASYNTHFFVHENKHGFDNSFFKPDIAHLMRVNTYLDLHTNSAFQFRLNLGVGQKKIILSNRFRLPTGGIFRNAIEHEIISADLSFLSYYSIGQAKTNEFRPIAGFYISTNKYTGAVHKTSVGGSGNNLVTDDDFSPIFLEFNDYPFMLYVGVNAGVSYSTKIKKRNIQWVGLFYWSPSNMFGADFTYQANFIQQTIQGKYHYLSLGMNFALNRKG